MIEIRLRAIWGTRAWTKWPKLYDMIFAYALSRIKMLEFQLRCFSIYGITSGLEAKLVGEVYKIVIMYNRRLRNFLTI